MSRESEFSSFGSERELRDHCGIVAAFAPGRDVVGIAAAMLGQLNHRGHEGSGEAAGTLEGTIETYKGSGLTRDVLTLPNLASLRAMNPEMAIGQNRYSTSGTEAAWQPFEYHGTVGVHNGNITNAMTLLAELPPEVQLEVVNDTDVIVKAIALAPGVDLKEKSVHVLGKVEGAANLIIMGEGQLIAYRDPWGFRPLSVATLPQEGEYPLGIVIASETCAYDSVGATYLRDILPGEGVVVGRDGNLNTFFIDPRIKDVSLARCIFELVYFSAPDSKIFGKSVSSVRRAIGEISAQEDIESGFLPGAIIPVQHSGIPYAEGYATAYIKAVVQNPQKFGLRNKDLPEVVGRLQTVTGLVVNQYSGKRAFIESDNRAKANIIKHRVDQAVVEGKKVVVFDDSIVRADAALHIVKLLKKNGAVSVHLRIGCPPIKHPCSMGVDTPDPQELAWNRFGGSVAAIKEQIKADSLRYITEQQLLYAVVGEDMPDNDTLELYRLTGYCGACFLGEIAKYPVDTRGVFVKQ